MDIYENIFDSLPFIMVLCDKDFKVLKANNSFRALVEKKAESKNIKEFFTQFKYESAFESQFDNKPVKVSVEDIGDKKLVIIEFLSDMNEAHSDFVSTVSHELRTPLTSIRGFADTLLKSSDRLDNEQKRRFINIIKDQADRLSKLVENLLSVSKLESQKDTNILKPINLKALVETILEVLQAKYPTHQFELINLENTPDIWADGDKLYRVFINLIENAAKYSDENTTVKIEAKTQNEKIKIKIIDQGVGIPKEFLESIFTKFSRIDNPLTRKVQGSGLGLYIAKSLVSQMDGKIKVENNPSSGVSFEVEFPIATEDKYQEKFLQSKE